MKLKPPFESRRVRTQPSSRTFRPTASALRAPATLMVSTTDSPEVAPVSLASGYRPGRREGTGSGPGGAGLPTHTAGTLGAEPLRGDRRAPHSRFAEDPLRRPD